MAPASQISAASRPELRGDLTDKRERTRQRLLKATLELAGREDGLRMRIEEVCVSAKVSRGTFYNYFSSLDELFAALWSTLNSEAASEIGSQARLADNVAEETGVVVLGYLNRARRDRLWGWAMVNLAATGLVLGSHDFGVSLSAVERGIASGEFDVADARAGRDLIVGICLSAMVTQLREEVRLSHAEEAVRLLLRGLGVARPDVETILSKARTIARRTE